MSSQVFFPLFSCLIGVASFTGASKLLIMKFRLSINFRFPSEKEMYFSVLFGMHLISLCTPPWRKTAWLVEPSFDRCLTFFRTAVDLPYQRLEVGVHHERRVDLLVVVLEISLVFALFGQLGPYTPFQLHHAFVFVSFEQSLCCVAMQTAFAEMFYTSVPSCSSALNLLTKL